MSTVPTAKTPMTLKKLPTTPACPNSSMMVGFALPSMSVLQERSDFGMGTLTGPGPEAANALHLSVSD